MLGELHSHTEVPEAKPFSLEGFREIKSELGTTFQDAKAFVNELFEREDSHYVSYGDRFCYTPVEGDRGKWEGDRAESKFVPSETTEAGRAVKEKLAEYGMDGITYKDAEPDFSKCAEATVTIDHMTGDRYSRYDDNGTLIQGNFYKADVNCAELWNHQKKDGRSDWSAAEVRDWRVENKFSWHECCDTKTMMLVSADIHGYFGHSGGVAECKARDNVNTGGGFDE